MKILIRKFKRLENLVKSSRRNHWRQGMGKTSIRSNQFCFDWKRPKWKGIFKVYDS